MLKKLSIPFQKEPFDRKLRTPAFVGHLVRFSSDSKSDLIRTGNPVPIGHLIRSLSDTESDGYRTLG